MALPCQCPASLRLAMLLPRTSGTDFSLVVGFAAPSAVRLASPAAAFL
jgi:hypothetical protein